VTEEQEVSSAKSMTHRSYQILLNNSIVTNPVSFCRRF